MYVLYHGGSLNPTFSAMRLRSISLPFPVEFSCQSGLSFEFCQFLKEHGLIVYLVDMKRSKVPETLMESFIVVGMNEP